MRGVLGTPLDKSEQCSAWHKRPLTDAQLAYAATDAAVLLALLDALATVAQPAAFPFQQRDGSAAPADTPATDTSADASAAGSETQAVEAVTRYPSADPDSRSAVAAKLGCEQLGTAQRAASPRQGRTEDRLAQLTPEPARESGYAAHVKGGPHQGRMRIGLVARADNPIPPHRDSHASLQMRRYEAGVVGASAWMERCNANDGAAAADASAEAPGFGGSKQRVSTGPAAGQWPPLAAAPALVRSTAATSSSELPARMARMVRTLLHALLLLRVTATLRRARVREAVACCELLHAYASAKHDLSPMCTRIQHAWAATPSRVQAVAAEPTGAPGPLTSFPLLSLSAEVLSDFGDDEGEPESLAAEVGSRAQTQRLARGAADAAEVARAWSFRIEFEGGRFRRIGMPRSSQKSAVRAHAAL